ncbi:MAG: bile acid:sodium symporter family protein [Candidatus Kuenenia sp.]|nr:bile acid:sodium symporter family protein [Candidatus Kuenenia hertensis]
MIERYFLVISLLLSAIALFYPPGFIWARDCIPYLLGIIMFGMGLTLTTRDFINVWKSKRAVFLGVAAQFFVMPLLAITLSLLLKLPESIFIGMVLLGACPGGTASNVITYLAKGNVALSVTMTLVSTMVSPIITPAIVYFSAGKWIEINFWMMVKSVFWIVVFPLADGLLVRHLLKSKVKYFVGIFPGISIIAISFVIAIIMGLNKSMIITFPHFVVLAVIFHNSLGLLIGFGIGKLFSCSARDCRTISIEVGMQNSGLGVSLATVFFSAQSALPSALFSLWHNISGITLAKYWSKKSLTE